MQLEIVKRKTFQYAVFESTFQESGSTYGIIWDKWLQSSEYEQDTT